MKPVPDLTAEGVAAMVTGEAAVMATDGEGAAAVVAAEAAADSVDSRLSCTPFMPSVQYWSGHTPEFALTATIQPDQPGLPELPDKFRHR